MATALQKKQSHVRSTLNGYFEKHKDQLVAALPSHLNPDRMARIALTAFNGNSALANCTPESLFGAVITASQLGLEIGIVGQGFLVPYKNTCTFIPGWKGYVDLVSRTGRASVWTGAVYEGDHFEYSLGTNPHIEHRPGDEDDIDKLTHVYAVGRVNGAEHPVIEVWSKKKIIKHRDKYNKQRDKHYSYKHFERYARKIPLLRVIDFMPKSIELSNACKVDVAATEGKRSEYIDGEFMPVDNDDYQEQEADQPQQSTISTASTPKDRPFNVYESMEKKINDMQKIEDEAAITGQINQHILDGAISKEQAEELRFKVSARADEFAPS